MKLTIDRGPALEALQRVQGAAGNGKTIPILGHVLLDGHREGGLTIRATDQVLEASSDAPATVEQAGRVCVEAAHLQQILRSAPEGAELGLELNKDNRLAVKVARSRFAMPTLPAADFPTFAAPGDDLVRGAIGAKAFVGLLDKAIFAVSHDEARHYLRGVHLHVLQAADGPRLRAVATNGTMLAYGEAECPEDLAGLSPLTIPSRAVGEFKRWLADLNCDVQIAAEGGRLRVDLEGASLATSLIDGAFPGYERVIPRAHPHLAAADRALLQAALKRVLIASEATGTDKVRGMRVDLSAGQARLHARGFLRGEAEEALELQYDGPEVSIGFNGPQLQVLVDQLQGPRVELRFNTQAEPVLVLDPADESRLSLVIGLRV